MQKRRVGSWPGLVSLCGTIGLVLVAAWLSSCGMSSEAGTMLPEQPIPPEGTLVEAPRTGEPAAMHPKLDSSLNQLLDAYQREGMAGAQAFAETRGLVLDGQRVQVVLVMAPESVEGLTEAVEELTEAVAGEGGEVQGHYEGLLEALVPIEALASLAELPEVQQIREPQRAVPK
jgi:hypothetical protein